ncbi:hypothetical protein FI667_g2753, partial [Globisporangium splendens]
MVIVILDEAAAKENSMQTRDANACAAPEQPEGVGAEDVEPLRNFNEARQEQGEKQEKTVAQEENCLGGASSVALPEGKAANGVAEAAEQRGVKDTAPVQEEEEMKNADEGEVKEVTVEATIMVESGTAKGEADMTAAASAMVLGDTKAGEEVQVMEPQVVEIIDDLEQPDDDVAESDPKLTDAKPSAHDAASDVTVAVQSPLSLEIRSEERELQSESAGELIQLSEDQDSHVDAPAIDTATEDKHIGEKERHATATLKSSTDHAEQNQQAATEVEVVVIEQEDTTPIEIDTPADPATITQTSFESETTLTSVITEDLSQSATEAAISNEPQAPDAVSNQEDTSEQWFGDADMSDNDGHLIPVNDEDASVDDDDDDEPVFVGTSSAADTFQLENNLSKQKRKRPSGGDESDATHEMESGDESSSSSGSDSDSSSSSSSSSSGSSSSGSSDSESDDDASKRKAKVAKKAHHESTSHERPRTAAAKPKKPRVAAPRTVPPQFKVFDNVSLDNREFPILRGSYVIKGNHRAVFSGNWGFCDADFTAGGDRLSKFEYTSIYLHGRHDSDRRPFSGKYGGYFNFRQFSGKIIKIKEEQVELNFVKLPGDNKSESSDGDDDSDDEEAFAKSCYEVYGSGKNRFGHFLIRGFLSPATSKLVMRRHYLD